VIDLAGASVAMAAYVRSDARVIETLRDDASQSLRCRLAHLAHRFAQLLARRLRRSG